MIIIKCPDCKGEGSKEQNLGEAGDVPVTCFHCKGTGKVDIMEFFGLCSCDEAYKKRALEAPDCPYHAFAVEEALEEYAQQKAELFADWMTFNASKFGKQDWLCHLTKWHTRHTIGEIYQLYQQQKQL